MGNPGESQQQNCFFSFSVTGLNVCYVRKHLEKVFPTPLSLFEKTGIFLNVLFSCLKDGQRDSDGVNI